MNKPKNEQGTLRRVPYLNKKDLVMGSNFHGFSSRESKFRFGNLSL
jgi:hypothetical protein